MRILLVASMTEEIGKTLDYLKENWEKENFFTYRKGEHSITHLVTGIGSMHASFAVARQQDIEEYDILVNPGVAAALSRTMDLNRVYLIEKDRIGDLGLERSNGDFQDLHDLQWVDPNQYPYFKSALVPKKLHNPTFLPTCSAITVNKLPGHYLSIENFERKYHVDIVSLDAGAVLYASRMLQLETIQFRVVTKYIEAGDKQNGDIEQALNQLSMRTIDVLEALVKPENKEDNNSLMDLFN